MFYFISCLFRHDFHVSFERDMIYSMQTSVFRPTQSVMYVPLQVNRFHKSFLLIGQYRYLNSCSGDFYSPESDPPHKIVRYWIYYPIWLGFSFPPDHAGLVEMILPQLYQFRRGISGGPALEYFYMIHRGGRAVY